MLSRAFLVALKLAERSESSIRAQRSAAAEFAATCAPLIAPWLGALCKAALLLFKQLGGYG